MTQFESPKPADNDDNMSISQPPIFNMPALIKYTCLVLILVHLVRYILPEDMINQLYGTFAFIPARYMNAQTFNSDILASIVGPLGHTLVHGDWFHLLANMGMFIAFGTALYRLAGPVFCVLSWISGALAGAYIMYAINDNPMTILIGASASVSAILGSLLFLSWILARYGYMPSQPFASQKRITSFLFLWVIVNLIFAFTPAEAIGAKIAWEAHLAGLFAGAVIAWIYLKILKKTI